MRIEADEMRLQIPLQSSTMRRAKNSPRNTSLIQFEDGSPIAARSKCGAACSAMRRVMNLKGSPWHASTNTNPSPLEDEFDFPYFRRLAEPEATKALSAKAFLATEQRIVGLGNGVLQDILWTAKIHPKRVMETLSDAEFRRMFDAVKTVLRDMAAQGGRDTERDLFGMPGGYKTTLSRKTVGTPCPECGETIRKEAYLGGSV